MKIYKVEKSVVDEYSQETPLEEKFFDSFEKTDIWIGECLTAEKKYASKVTCYAGTYLHKFNILRIVNQFFDKCGCHHRYVVSEVEVA